MKFAAEVQVGGDPNWYSNSLVFDTREEAEAYGNDLHSRWTATTAWRVKQLKEMKLCGVTTGVKIK